MQKSSYHQLTEGENNNYILSLMFADEVQTAREKHSLKAILKELNIEVCK